VSGISERDARLMVRETPCLSCHGSGMIPAPWDGRPDGYAHQYSVICGCGVFLERPGFSSANYQRGGPLPWNAHRLALARAAGFVAWVDERLLADVERLWLAGIGTWASCQGGAPHPAGGRVISICDAARADEAMALLDWAAVAEPGIGGKGTAHLREAVTRAAREETPSP
jgi:hypothetical protein